MSSPQSPEYLPQIVVLLLNREQRPLVNLKPEAKYPAELVAIAEELRTLTATYNPVEIVTPSSQSVREEKGKVFQAVQDNESYNPTFEYSNAKAIDTDVLGSASTQLTSLLNQVRAFKPSDEFDRIAKVGLYYKIKDELATIQLITGIQSQNDAVIKVALQQKYGKLDTAIISQAEDAYHQAIIETINPRLIENNPLLSPEEQQLLMHSELTAEEVKEAFEWILGKYGMLRTAENPNGYAVVLDPNTQYIDVRDKSTTPMTIFIPPTPRTAIKVLQLCQHEIECHARQSANGIRFKIGGGTLKIDEETLYEGLARYSDHLLSERYFGKPDTSPDMLYVIAIAQAEEGRSFFKVFYDQLERNLHILTGVPHHQPLTHEDPVVNQHLPKAREEAWKRTYRVFRGHIDTANTEAYAFGKDAAYFRGIQLHRQLTELRLSYINELAIMQVDALALMGRLNLEESDVPFPYQNLTQQYCFEVLLPKLRAREK